MERVPKTATDYSDSGYHAFLPAESTKDICMIKMMYSVPFLSSIGVI